MASFLAPSVCDVAMASVVAWQGGLKNPCPPRAEDDRGVWVRMNRPMDEWMMEHGMSSFRGVSQRMTPLCASSGAMRFRGLDRWMCAMERFCAYQLREEVRWQNRALLKEETCRELYGEIDRILPSLEYCRVGDWVGDDGVRLPGELPAEVSADRHVTREALDWHAAVLYKWLDGPSKWQIVHGGSLREMSVVRALAEWQCAGGVSFDAVMNHRAARCFKQHGNIQYSCTESVSLVEFQAAVRCGHAYGGSGRGDDGRVADGGAEDGDGRRSADGGGEALADGDGSANVYLSAARAWWKREREREGLGGSASVGDARLTAERRASAWSAVSSGGVVDWGGEAEEDEDVAAGVADESFERCVRPRV